MRRAAVLLSGMAAIFWLAACATPYQPRGATGGYEDQALGGGKYRIDVRVNAYAGTGTAESYFYRRAEDIAREHGYEGYRVVQIQSGVETIGIIKHPYARGVIEAYGGAAAQQAAAGNSEKKSGQKGFGTGFFVSSDGVLLTNHHVIAECRRVWFRQVDGVGAALSLIADDPTNDLALLRTKQMPAAVATFRDGAEIRQGENVIAVGFPLTGSLSSGTILTTGSVSALAGGANDSRELQVSAPLQPGNSGGPLFDQSGHVVGINSSGLDVAAWAASSGIVPQNVNFAIKSSVARTFMDINSIAYRKAASGRDMTTADIGSAAQKFTVLVVCEG